MPLRAVLILAALFLFLLEMGYSAMTCSAPFHPTDRSFKRNGILQEGDFVGWAVPVPFHESAVDWVGAGMEGEVDDAGAESSLFHVLVDPEKRGENPLLHPLTDPPETPESEEFQRLVEQMEKLLEELRRAGDEVREKMERDVLPRLKEEMEKLQDLLEKYRDEDEGEPVAI